jgi:hypothetical protein
MRNRLIASQTHQKRQVFGGLQLEQEAGRTRAQLTEALEVLRPE